MMHARTRNTLIGLLAASLLINLMLAMMSSGTPFG